MVPSQEMFRGLKDTFGRMTDVQTAVQALQEAELFRTQVGEFGTDMARQMAMDPKTSPCKNYSPQHLLTLVLQYFAYKLVLHMQRLGGCCLDQALRTLRSLLCCWFHNVVRPVDASATGVLLPCCIQRSGIACPTRNLTS
jgi:hypothetical protein